MNYKLNNEFSEFPIVVSFQHSGTIIPNEVRAQFKKNVILPNMDWFLPELYDFINNMGVTSISSNISRYVVDLNRDKLIVGDSYNNSVVYIKNTMNNALYDINPSNIEIKRRIEEYYEPYHKKLEQLLSEKIIKFGKVMHLDLHSFFKQLEYDICLGNADNFASSQDILNMVEKALVKEQFSVTKNNIFKGGNTIRHYKRNFGNTYEGILLELNYKKYIENRFFYEEEVKEYNYDLFTNCKYNLLNAFSTILKNVWRLGFKEKILFVKLSNGLVLNVKFTSHNYVEVFHGLYFKVDDSWLNLVSILK